MRLLFALPFCILLFCSLTLADPPEPLWVHTYGGENEMRAYALGRANDGGFFVGGSVQSSGQGQGAFLMRLTEDQDSVWIYKFPASPSGVDSSVTRGLVPTADGGCLLAVTRASQWMSSPVLIKVNPLGDSVWTVLYTQWSRGSFAAITQGPDSALTMAGSTIYSGSQPDQIVLRTSRTGGIRWTHTYGAAADQDYGLGVAPTPDSGAVIAGRMGTTSDPGGGGAALLRLDSRGVTRWLHSYGGPTSLEAASVVRNPDGGFTLAGSWNTGDSRDAYAVRTDSMGSSIWSQHWGGNLEDGANAVQRLTNGMFAVVGWTHAAGHTDKDGLISVLDSSGDVLWNQTYGGMGDDVMTSVIPAEDGGFYVAGYTQAAPDSVTQACFMRFPPGSGIQGVVRDSVTHQPVPNVVISAIGHTGSARSDAQGNYSLYVVPGTYTFAMRGTCVARDTLRNFVVLPDSMRPVDWTVKLPDGAVPQTSMNPVVHNHIPADVPLYIYNNGPGLLDFSIVTEEVAPSHGWLSVNPQSGSVAANDSFPAMVHVVVDTTNDGIYDFLGYLYVTLNSCPDSFRTVAVSLNVLDAAVTPAALPVQFGLSAYPNPFNPQTVLTLALPERTPVTLVLYDVLGRQVQTLTSGVLEAGVHRLTVEGSALPSGLYFARVQTPKITKTVKLMLLK